MVPEPRWPPKAATQSAWCRFNFHKVTVTRSWYQNPDGHQRQPHSQGSWLWPDRPAGAHCCRLLMTSWASGKDTGIVTSMWVYSDSTNIDLDFEGFQVLKNMFKSACPTEGQGPVTINLNCIFFAMVSSQDTYKLLIVSHVLSSGHDLVTWWWVHRLPTSFNFKFWNLACTFSR